MPPPPRPNLIAKTVPAKKQESTIYIQESLGDELRDSGHESDYTSKISAPIYKPSGKKPNVFELVDTSKSSKMTGRIAAASVSPQEKKFLTAAAQRHNVFNYKKIADYYAQSSPDMQKLMEESGLVIIDFADAIRLGYVKFTEEIAKIYVKEHGKTE